MKFKIENNLSHQVSFILRKRGYFFILDRISGENSFVKKLTNNHYPRFHLYILEEGNQIIFDLHLDQSATRYNNQTAHNADYNSLEVKEELKRIYQTVKPFVLEKQSF